DIRVDFCHRQARLIVEIDGLGKLYLGSGVPREELERERSREQWLRERGWRVIRISWQELFQEAIRARRSPARRQTPRRGRALEDDRPAPPRSVRVGARSP